MMSLNHALFLSINAAPDAHFAVVSLGLLCGEMLIWGLPLMLVVGWLRGDAPTRRAMLEVFLAAMLALAINQLIGAIWPQPRPFVLGLGRRLIEHSADPSFPSDHMTLMSVSAISLWLQGWRKAGVIWAFMALATAWGRIYLGVHFPLDMLGAVAVAGVAAQLCRRFGRRSIDRLHGGLQAAWSHFFAH